MYTNPQIEQLIEAYVEVKGCSSFDDLMDKEKYSLVRDAVHTNFGDISSVIKEYGIDKIEDACDENDSSLGFHDHREIMNELIKCFEPHFDFIFERLYLKAYHKNRISFSKHRPVRNGAYPETDLATEYCDPVASDRRALTKELNYQREMFIAMFPTVFGDI